MRESGVHPCADASPFIPHAAGSRPGTSESNSRLARPRQVQHHAGGSNHVGLRNARDYVSCAFAPGSPLRPNEPLSQEKNPRKLHPMADLRSASEQVSMGAAAKKHRQGVQRGESEQQNGRIRNFWPSCLVSFWPCKKSTARHAGASMRNSAAEATQEPSSEILSLNQLMGGKLSTYSALVHEHARLRSTVHSRSPNWSVR